MYENNNMYQKMRLQKQNFNLINLIKSTVNRRNLRNARFCIEI